MSGIAGGGADSGSTSQPVAVALTGRLVPPSIERFVPAAAVPGAPLVPVLQAARTLAQQVRQAVNVYDYVDLAGSGPGSLVQPDGPAGKRTRLAHAEVAPEKLGRLQREGAAAAAGLGPLVQPTNLEAAAAVAAAAAAAAPAAASSLGSGGGNVAAAASAAALSTGLLFTKIYESLCEANRTANIVGNVLKSANMNQARCCRACKPTHARTTRLG